MRGGAVAGEGQHGRPIYFLFLQEQLKVIIIMYLTGLQFDLMSRWCR